MGSIRELLRITGRPAVLAAAAAFVCFQLSTWFLAFRLVPDGALSFSVLWRTALFESLSWLVIGAAGVAAGWLLPLDVERRPSVVDFAVLFAAGLALVVVRLAMVQLFAVHGGADGGILLLHVPNPEEKAPPLLPLLAASYPWHLLIATSYIGLGCGLRGVRRYHEGLGALARLDAELAEVRFTALRSRLHPRVLGAMESIAAEIQADPDRADRRLMRLSDFIRLQLARGRLEVVALRDELAYVEGYLDFERSCRGTAVELASGVPAGLADAPVPTGCIAVAVEALLRPLEAHAGPLRISVTARDRRDPVEVTVQAVHGPDSRPVLAPDALARLAATLGPQASAADGSPRYAPASAGLVVTVGGYGPPSARPHPADPGRPRGDELDGEEARAERIPHPATGIPRVIRTWFLWYWATIAALGFSQDFLLGHPFTSAGVTASLALNAGCVVLWGGVCWITLALARGTGRLHPRRIVLGAAAAFVLGTANHLLQTLVWCLDSPYRYCFVNSIPALASTIAITINLFAVCLVIRAAALSAERERRSSLVRAEMTRSQTLALERQLRPHFLFNALQSIATLIHRDRAAAAGMLRGLRELLRHSLAASGRAEVPLDAELRSLRLYLDIEALRFSDKLSVELVIDPAALEASVPPFLLQPLAENAVHHAVAARGAGHIRISAGVDAAGQRLKLTVEDDGSGQPRPARPGPRGIGLENARARLRNLYGDGSRLDLDLTEQAGGTVSVHIPFRVPAPS